MNINNENSLENSRVIYDITKFTHLDYPDHLACILWFSSCNMRCDYCYNPDIVFAKSSNYSLMDALDFLKTRVGLLDGVVLSGGEATLHHLIEFAQKIKELGYAIKLDTNGINYESIKKLLDLNLLDFVALDYKAPKYKFTQITHSEKYENFSKTLDLLISRDINFEVRTTLHYDLLDEEDINFIIKDLKKRAYTNSYYLQNFMDTGSNIGNLKTPQKNFHKERLIKDINILYR